MVAVARDSTRFYFAFDDHDLAVYLRRQRGSGAQPGPSAADDGNRHMNVSSHVTARLQQRTRVGAAIEAPATAVHAPGART